MEQGSSSRLVHDAHGLGGRGVGRLQLAAAAQRDAEGTEIPGTDAPAHDLRLAAGLQAQHVPFRGTPEAMTEVMGGRVDWFFAPMVSALPLIGSGFR